MIRRSLVVCGFIEWAVETVDLSYWARLYYQGLRDKESLIGQRSGLRHSNEQGLFTAAGRPETIMTK